jgi:hypothetical protein
MFLACRLIEGVVRKWMGSQPAPVRRNFVVPMRSGVPDKPREAERLDPTDTGVMATRRLAPFVSEEEEGEYQRSAACSLCHFHFFFFVPLPLNIY